MAVIACCVAAGALACADGDDDIKALGAGCGCCCVIALVVMFFFTANEVASLTETAPLTDECSSCSENLIFCNVASSSDSGLGGVTPAVPSDGNVQDMSECE